MPVSVLLLGFLLGLRHALDADHVAAVAALAGRGTSLRDGARLATAWGIGHGAVIVVVGAAMIATEVVMPAPVSAALEGVAGAVLVWLGIGVLRRVREDRLHVHVHRHDGGAPHVHVHAHRDASDHHHHRHGHGAPILRTLIVGATHGLAGTAALVLVVVPAARSAGWAVAYLGVFAAGSVAGMVLCAVAMAIPLRWTDGRGERAARGLERVIGAGAIALGGWMVLAP